MEDLTIERCDNGYSVFFYDEEQARERMVIFEEPDTEIGELLAMHKLLWFVKEHFGVFHSKHNKQNLVIEIQGKDDGNPIIN